MGNIINYYDSFEDLSPPKELVKCFHIKSDLSIKIYYNYDRQQSYNTVRCGHLCLKFVTNNEFSDDSKRIKRMADSLRIFLKYRKLTKLPKEQLANIPKEVMINCASNEIAWVWDKLPEHLKSDIDIMKSQYCLEHYSDYDNTSQSSDVNDGPVPRKISCCYCSVRDDTVVSENKLSASINIVPSTSKQEIYLNYCCKQQ